MTPLEEIRRLYFATTRATVQRDLARAVALLKSLPSEAERQRAAVFMDGLSQMRSEWAAGGRKTGHARSASKSKTRRTP